MPARMHAGIMFNDITPLLLRPAVFKDAVDMFVERYRGMGIAAVAGKKPEPEISHHQSRIIIASSWFMTSRRSPACSRHRTPLCRPLRLPASRSFSAPAAGCSVLASVPGAGGALGLGAARRCSEIP